MTIKNLKHKLPKNNLMVVNQGFYTDGNILIKKDYAQTALKDFNIAMQYENNFGIQNKNKMDTLPDLQKLTKGLKNIIDNMQEVNFLYDTNLIETGVLNKRVYTTHTNKYIYLNTAYTDYLDQFKNIRLVSSNPDNNFSQIIIFDTNTVEPIGLLMPVAMRYDNEFLKRL